MLKRIALGLQYDGGPWHGWQTQPHGRTVQDVLESALAKFCQAPIATTCAGRTDAGVHALSQVVHFDTTVSRENFSWVRGVNAFLPDSIAVQWATEVEGGEQGFHARFSALMRTYHYVIYNYPVRSPLSEGRTGWVFRPLDVALMEDAAKALIGQHDFSAFRAAECQAASPVRTLHHIAVVRHGDRVIVTLSANAFLHHMVRNIIGSLVYIGCGRQAPEWMRTLLAARDRTEAAPTFEAAGLYLTGVDYDVAWQLPDREQVKLPRPARESRP